MELFTVCMYLLVLTGLHLPLCAAVKQYSILKAWGQCSTVALLLTLTQNSCATAPQLLLTVLL